MSRMKFPNRESLKELRHDHDFLVELNESMEKWRDGNCWESRDHAFTLVEDWTNEIANRIATKESAAKARKRKGAQP